VKSSVRELADAGRHFARELRALLAADSTTEESYYPALSTLFTRLLSLRTLPFQVRVNTSEQRSGVPGFDRPDVALYDREDFPAVFCEVKLPSRDVRELAFSTDGGDQIGRYLAQTGVVILTNLRSLALLTCKAETRRTTGLPVAPRDRLLEEVVDLWPSEVSPTRGQAPDIQQLEGAADLIERAVTEFAPIAEPASLARILARQARKARNDLPARFDTVQRLLEDYRTALGLTFAEKEGDDFFRSSLIQTAFYALFASWTLWHRAEDGSEFSWRSADKYLRIPFLRQLFFDFRHPDRLAELGLEPHLDRASDTLKRVDCGAFFSRFTYGTPVRPEDGQPQTNTAITYFYEPFLEAFDPDLRKRLGVWYTPPEIVRYQVRKANQLLKERLGCPRGFGDDRVVVLDPCCGTGAYLLEVLQCIAEDLLSRGDESLLAAHLLEAVSHRVIGFEILTAPFVVAQLQIHLLLADLGVHLGDRGRPAIYLTNSLTGWEEPEQVRLNFPELQSEHDESQRVKRGSRIIVVLGNPPYNRFAGTALAEEADLVDHYKGIVRIPKRDPKGRVQLAANGQPVMVQQGESQLYSRWGIKKHLLDDLYIRFFRLAEKRIGEHAQFGVVSFISNSSYLTGRSHPIMRESLLRSFREVWIDNMHGNRLASERTPWGESCETLFNVDAGPGIKVGTVVSTFVKAPLGDRQEPGECVSSVYYRDFWGRASAKRRALLDSLRMDSWDAERRAAAAQSPPGPRPYEVLHPTKEARWMLCPRDENQGYEAWPSVDELFPTFFQGVNPNRGLEGSLVDTDRPALVERMRTYFSDLPNATVADRVPVLMTARARYTPSSIRDLLRRNTTYQEAKVVPYVVFPLDARWLYYETEAKLLNERRPEFWDNLTDNEFFITVPQPRRVSESRPMLARTLVDLHLHDRGSVCFPVWSRSGALISGRANLHDSALGSFARAWALRQDDEAETRTLVRHLFRAALALMHAPCYQRDHEELLGLDWARLPLPRSRQDLHALVALGDQVATLLDPLADADSVVTDVLGDHTGRSLGVVRTENRGAVSQDDLAVTVSYYGAAAGRWIGRTPAEGEELRPEWGESTGDLFINPQVCFANIPAKIWAYELGGYPVLKKWLGYRHRDRRGGRPLTLAEAGHFRSMVQRIGAMLTLGSQLDDAYQQAAAGAWTAEELGVRSAGRGVAPAGAAVDSPTEQS